MDSLLHKDPKYEGRLKSSWTRIILSWNFVDMW